MKSYWVPIISREKELSRERFQEGRDKRGLANKPRGGLFTSLWHPEWGPEWGLYWIFHFCLPEERDLWLDVWEVELNGWRVARAGRGRPDFEGYKSGRWDAILVDPFGLEERWGDLPLGEKWWLGWDVRTVWIPTWPEGRLRRVGRLVEVVPKPALERYLEAIGSRQGRPTEGLRWWEERSSIR